LDKFRGLSLVVAVTFEFDANKSQSNREKHGIDFIEAQKLWFVSGYVVPGGHRPEARFLRIARLADGRLWTAIYTERGGNVRIISVRRARKAEVEAYEKNLPEN
jgi:uncharacterized DUF497 family protein